jgi:septal ring-binding cell division protein DamX
MRFEFAQGKKLLMAIFAVVALVVIVVVIWKVRAHKAFNSSTTTIVQKETSVSSSSPKPAEGVAPQIPNLVPGDTCEKASEVYGDSSEKDEHDRTWRKRDFEVFVGLDSRCVITSEEVAIVTGHTALTPDGVMLGKSTLADVERILLSHGQETSESVDAPEGDWEAVVERRPTQDASYTTVYRATLNPKAVNHLKRDPVFADFRDVPVSGYGLQIAAQNEQAK